MRLNYNVLQKGNELRKWKVELTVFVGINPTVDAEADNQNEAEKKCAWMMVDLLLENDLVHESEIPLKPITYPLEDEA